MQTNTYIQNELGIEPLVETPAIAGESLQDRFKRFHDNNPGVYVMLLKLACKFRAKNPNRKLGIKMLFEVLRWNYYITTDGQEDYKINNNYAPFYSRLIMANFPELNGCFEIRTSVADL